MTTKNELRVKHGAYADLRTALENRNQALCALYKEEAGEWTGRSSVSINASGLGLKNLNLIRFMPSMKDSFSALIVEETQAYLEQLNRFGVSVLLIQGNKITSVDDISVTKDLPEDLGESFGVRLHISDMLADEYRKIGINTMKHMNRYATFITDKEGTILFAHVNETPGDEVAMDTILKHIEHRLFEISDGIKKNHNELSEFESHVIDQKGTERAYTGEYWDHKAEGLYVCRKCNAPLYWSYDKFDSHCGWPSFDDEIKGSVKRTRDQDGYRTEITCANCGGHLGHVFEGEGFTDKDTRHCVNSVSIKFVPIDEYQK